MIGRPLLQAIWGPAGRRRSRGADFARAWVWAVWLDEAVDMAGELNMASDWAVGGAAPVAERMGTGGTPALPIRCARSSSGRVLEEWYGPGGCLGVVLRKRRNR